MFYKSIQWRIFIFSEGVAAQDQGPRATKAEECFRFIYPIKLAKLANMHVIA